MTRTEMEVLLTLYGWMPAINGVWHEDYGLVTTFVSNGQRYITGQGHAKLTGQYEWSDVDDEIMPELFQYIRDSGCLPKPPRFRMTGTLS